LKGSGLGDRGKRKISDRYDSDVAHKGLKFFKLRGWSSGVKEIDLHCQEGVLAIAKIASGDRTAIIL
jgi:hypothetical protein